MEVQMTKVKAIERDALTGWTKVVDKDDNKERFMCTSKDAAQRLAILLGVPFVDRPYVDPE